MRRLTVFTVLYLTLGTCLAAIALQQPDTASKLKNVLFFNVGLLYLFAVLSTFQFWQQYVLNSYSRLREQAVWRQKIGAIAPWLIIATTLFSFVFIVLTENWTNYAIGQAATTLTIILLCVEQLFIRHRNSL
ncbi:MULTISPECIES: hypothetical protein [unclassified Tolypothrix]|uniref:hypothetical protein n=1 Tax=unclassified Tolypothrix TaxID=2649714 RepID=UPI0005EAC357|nr:MULTISPECIES: hypothetical protein [unclassified Tolypothrix]BAY93247.1 hypothetical protein NIES3275_52860 [Microchaete diplosiphon NIES-3275]EKF00165.1 hypothetical protein FDUTEX481_09200 [Tolypothrix sp. PCC 7601]MBE9083169.1 hypothetical protein [Tolypothrix sp. LEGE 11397]UYD27116.1 hypothetical protein HGR01_03130 [Tolypothrix sp. PCC 7712]UYD37026.1 hypothetical protein HG267_15630 [Tolypothrix sp. PCC 7601]